MENEKRTEINQPFIEEPIKALNALFKLLYEGQEFTNSEYNFWLKLHQIVAEALKKLDKLEEIEKELGIDLLTLFEALKNGIYWKGENAFNTFGIFSERKPELDIKNQTLKHIVFLKNQDYVSLKDYGKTWALTKKELE